MSKIKKVLSNGGMLHAGRLLLFGLVVFGSVLAAYYTAQGGQDREIASQAGRAAVAETRIKHLERGAQAVADELRKLRIELMRTTNELIRLSTEQKNATKTLDEIKELVRGLGR